MAARKTPSWVPKSVGRSCLPSFAIVTVLLPGLRRLPFAMASIKVESSVLGFPRIGANRELKRLVEKFWRSGIDEAELLSGAAELRRASWTMQKDLGLDRVPCNDFSLYDQVLDAACLVGAVPDRYKQLHQPGAQVSLQTYFAMARGIQKTSGTTEVDQPAMEMKKYFDTNYHYLVPELSEDTSFKVSSSKPFDEFNETKALGIPSRPVLVGPVSFLLLSKPSGSAQKGFHPLSLLNKVLPVYVDIVKRLVEEGATHIQFDEPMACMDPTPAAPKAALDAAYKQAYNALSAAAGSRTELMVSTYFQSPHPDLLSTLVQLPVQSIHVDVTRSSKDMFAAFMSKLSETDGKRGVSLGIVDGRNVWKVDAAQALSDLSPHVQALSSMNVTVSSSCSLLHSPWSLEGEDRLDSEVLDWMAFAKEKIVEIVNLSHLLEAKLNNKAVDASTTEWFAANKQSNERRRNSVKTRDPKVRSRTASVNETSMKRVSDAQTRQSKQQQHLNLPLFPTTTIGSFPQTSAIRKARADFKKGLMSDAEYEKFIVEETGKCIKFQEEVGLDVLVHGEFERNDMVEFFGEHLTGMLFTSNGWVQSYGSRCVKPPVIYGDVSRSKPMTVEMAKLAQSMSNNAPVKGMLTGPVTILQWSFVRNDQPRSVSCAQLALAVRDEVDDLQKAGIKVIQVDEPAIREGLPMRKSEQEAYLKWAVDCFLLSTCVAWDETQIHSHMCYSDFVDIVDAIRRMDSDVLSIESSRSELKLLSAFEESRYPNQLGPGLYDIHSPRIPSVKEMTERARKILKYLSARQFWINPDCGLKTRGWQETKTSLENLVAVAKLLRKETPVA
ncbi:5-methyltetrahydropteroyltriglutamate--homocysteine S-methyltransferase [Plasmodiophora brassicae]|uniref:5-methyltetrahydropteroyltriglutamate--homocysteine S-methyltransferase n=1 Tax=Plasmodiophora brassicae TaxID=37360 RepID=A0A3P3Y2U6_PLABS|nr:unnamed protein product [Plasmodiophora brassicae]